MVNSGPKCFWFVLCVSWPNVQCFTPSAGTEFWNKLPCTWSEMSDMLKNTRYNPNTYPTATQHNRENLRSIKNVWNLWSGITNIFIPWGGWIWPRPSYRTRLWFLRSKTTLRNWEHFYKPERLKQTRASRCKAGRDEGHCSHRQYPPVCTILKKKWALAWKRVAWKTLLSENTTQQVELAATCQLYFGVGKCTPQRQHWEQPTEDSAAYTEHTQWGDGSFRKWQNNCARHLLRHRLRWRGNVVKNVEVCLKVSA